MKCWDFIKQCCGLCAFFVGKTDSEESSSNFTGMSTYKNVMSEVVLWQLEEHLINWSDSMLYTSIYKEFYKKSIIILRILKFIKFCIKIVKTFYYKKKEII